MIDIYRIVISFLNIKDIPIVNREYLKSYVLNKWMRLNGLPLLVDITWHAPGFCHKYCVCRVVGVNSRIAYYTTRLSKTSIIL